MRRAVLFCALATGIAVTSAKGATATGKSTYNGITWTYTVVSSTTPMTAKLVGDTYKKACISPADYSGEVTIPGEFANNAYTNVGLDENAFNNCANVTKFKIPASVTSVNGAFQNCTALATVFFSAPKVTFSENAFVNCPNFTAFELSGDATANYAVEDGLLYNPAKTKLIRVPTGIVSVAIPDSVTSIWQNAFAYSKMCSLALPATLQEIGYRAFTMASSLESFSIPDSNPTYATRNGILYSKDLKTLICVPSACTNLIVLAGVTNIADNACLGCTSLKTVKCPTSLKRLGTYAFLGATAIKTITFKSDIPAMVTDVNLGNLTCSANVRYPERYKENWSAYLNAHGYKSHEPVSPTGFIMIFNFTNQSNNNSAVSPSTDQ